VRGFFCGVPLFLAPPPLPQDDNLSTDEQRGRGWDIAALILVRETISWGKFGALQLGEGEMYSGNLGRQGGLVPCGALIEF
jgi:hypothetical protein